ncbi:MAG: ABC transporter permease [Deltaproteobacteria bacterium]|nr:ABC transporter permease [Deltaproteobacteria bacterium]
MRRYIIKRILQAMVTILLIMVIIFFLSRAIGDPAVLFITEDAGEEELEILREKFGIDKPIWVQFVRFFASAARGDFGESFKWDEPALPLVLSRFPATLELAACAVLFSSLFGLSVGMITALKRDSWLDRFGQSLAVFGQAVPNFWLGLMLILLFGVYLKWLPISGREELSNVIMPALTLSAFTTASVTRLTRSSMLDVLGSEYIKMVRIKGAPERIVILKHGLRNALIPILTLISLQFGYLLGGSVIVETVFAWPGVGRLAIEAFFRRDFPVIQSVVFFMSFVFVTINLLVDILYAYIDPRIRYG